MTGLCAVVKVGGIEEEEEGLSPAGPSVGVRFIFSFPWQLVILFIFRSTKTIWILKRQQFL